MTDVTLCPHSEGDNAALSCLTQSWAAPEILRAMGVQVALAKQPVVPSLQKAAQPWKAQPHQKQQAQLLPGICEVG